MELCGMYSKYPTQHRDLLTLYSIMCGWNNCKISFFFWYPSSQILSIRIWIKTAPSSCPDAEGIALCSCRCKNITTLGLRENKDSLLLVQISKHMAGWGWPLSPPGPEQQEDDLRAQASVLGLSSAGHVQQTQQQFCGGAGCRAVSWFQRLGLTQAVRVQHAALWGNQR